MLSGNGPVVPSGAHATEAGESARRAFSSAKMKRCPATQIDYAEGCSRVQANCPSNHERALHDLPGLELPAGLFSVPTSGGR